MDDLRQVTHYPARGAGGSIAIGAGSVNTAVRPRRRPDLDGGFVAGNDSRLARGGTTSRTRTAASWWRDLDSIRARHLACRASDHRRVGGSGTETDDRPDWASVLADAPASLGWTCSAPGLSGNLEVLTIPPDGIKMAIRW